MGYDQKDNSAVCFENDKGDNQNRPDLKGRGMVNGALVWVSVWKKKDKNGKTFLSLSFQPRQESTGGGNEGAAPMPTGDGW
jgi:hypothetical protein